MPKLRDRNKTRKPGPKGKDREGTLDAKERDKRKSNIREQKFGSLDVKLYDESNPLTTSMAKDLLGWEEESDGVKFGNDYLLKDLDGKKIRCFNNPNNRPFDPILCRIWTAEILKKHWRLNGETIIIGRTGKIISGQHRLPALVLAEQSWKRDEHWQNVWGEMAPTMPALIVFGVDESDATVNTVDTGKPRQASDAIYRSEIFAEHKDAERQIRSRMLAEAVKLVWGRTGLKDDPHTPRRTHTETFEFIDRHRRLVKATEHIREEDDGSGGMISKFINTGASAGLLYLMASSKSDPKQYFGGPADENNADFELWDKACDFWVYFVSNKDFQPIRDAVGFIVDPDTGRGPLTEKVAMICKCWNVYTSGDDLSDGNLKLKYETDQDGIKHLVENPRLGGIDIGKDETRSLSDDEVKQTADEASESDEVRMANRKKLHIYLKDKHENNKTITFKEQLESLRENHDGKLLLFKRGSNYTAWGEDSTDVSKRLKIDTEIISGEQTSSFPNSKLNDNANRLVDAGFRVALVEINDKGIKVTDYEKSQMISISKGNKGQQPGQPRGRRPHDGS